LGDQEYFPKVYSLLHLLLLFISLHLLQKDKEKDYLLC